MAPKIIILLCTFNGERFLSEQLDSIAGQTHQNWKLIVSDDGSRDKTLRILEQYQSVWGADKIEIRRGPMRGFCQNFLSLACAEIDGDYFAFSDQDDVWLPHKLERALQFISDVSQELPLLYCSSTTYVDHHLSVIGGSPILDASYGFSNALVQNIAGGNTMIFNRHTKTLLEKIGLVDVILHDWWLYLLVTAAGGLVYYDKESSILYRQHEGALIGSNGSLIERFLRLKSLFVGEFKDSVNKNIEALSENPQLLCSHSLALLKKFKAHKNAGLFKRLVMIRQCQLRRHSFVGNLSLYLSVLLNRI
jgi:glycosyltransferase involved in cell wall biosynthesis